MVKLIYGPKGSGKSKRIMLAANNEITTAKGNHVYITDNLMHSIDIDRRIRFININDYGINNDTSAFAGFIKGLIAGDSDITKIYIDGVYRILVSPEKIEAFFTEAEKISSDFDIIFTVTIGGEELPEYAKKYADVC